ncbi:hypothetical protein T492DRAFT_591971 [Pavlovales sp. CCMP2436]|nr:hypothetical protein T492DRAFT_591971 [Pavlovales sp. CCMP2436]
MRGTKFDKRAYLRDRLRGDRGDHPEATPAAVKPAPVAPPLVAPRPAFVPRPIQAVSPKSVLITGAAGFIGSHFALLLLDKGGYKVTAIDDMSRSSWDTVLRLNDLAEVAKDTDFLFVKQVCVEAVVHFAGNAYVGESMKSPDKYFQNITVGTLQLLQAMDAASVSNLIFSSRCPTVFPITEETPQIPTNPYGLSKLHAEQSILAKSQNGRRFAVASLRYFNVIGADPSGRLGSWDYPRIMDAAMDAALGIRNKLTVMGDAFPTEDGTAVRDYIHVTDLVQAHMDALVRLDPASPLVYNVGAGQGYTVKKVIKVVEKVSGKTVPYEVGPPRPGDPHTLYSDPAKIKAELGWTPLYADLEVGVTHAWQWRLNNYPNGGASTIDPLAYAGPAYTTETDDTPAVRDDPRYALPPPLLPPSFYNLNLILNDGFHLPPV